MERYEEAFKTFDQNEEGENTGIIDQTKFKSLIRSLGFNPTEQVLNQYIQEMGNKSKITVEDCIPYCEKQNTLGKDKPDDILEAFKIFDKEGMGYISAKELKHILCNMAEKFTDDEIKDTIAALGGENNATINYTDLVKQICS